MGGAAAAAGGRGVEAAVEKAAAPPFPSQLLAPHPFQLSAAAAGGGGAHSLRTRRARRRGGQRRQCAVGRRRGEDEADWAGWTQKESWARASATRNAHRGQLRVRMALTRRPRPKCGCRAGFLRWVAEAALVAVVVCTRPPSRSTIPAPLPRSPARGAAWRRGFGLDTCWRRGAMGVPTAAAGTHGCHRPLRSTQPAPLRTDGGGAPLSTFAVAADPQRSAFTSAPCGGGGRPDSRRRRRRWRRPLADSLWLPSPGRTSLPARAVEAHGALSLCHPAAASPTTPPFGLRRVRRRGRPPAQATPSLPIRHPRAEHRNHTQTHTQSSTKHMYDTFKHISACKGMHS